MAELQRFQAHSVTAGHAGNNNLDGKGQSGFLLDWCRSEPRAVVAKPHRQILAEFFTSMLVLSAQFKYKPAVGVTNYLYWIDETWSLSLISPDEWSQERRAAFAGSCVLHPDMTWTISPSERLSEDNPVSDAVARAYAAFAESLDTDLPLEQVLPFYTGRLAYYQRLYASALSRSIRAAVTLGDQGSVSCRQWQTRLPRLERALLSSKD